MNMIHIGQIEGVKKGDIKAQVEYAFKFWSCCITRADCTLSLKKVFATQPARALPEEIDFLMGQLTARL